MGRKMIVGRRAENQAIPVQMNANFYIGIPYCLPTTPNHCGFCLFPTQDYGGNGAMLKYLDYLEKEAQMMACHLRHDRLSSVYVGEALQICCTPRTIFG